jgi:hypothetical protein
VVGTVAARQAPAFPQCSRDALSRPQFGLPIVSRAMVLMLSPCCVYLSYTRRTTAASGSMTS